MNKCEHLVLNLLPRLVEGPAGTTEILILACKECNTIADYFNPDMFNEEWLKSKQIKDQFYMPPDYYQNHVLRQQIQTLLADKEKMEEELKKSEDEIEKMKKANLSKVRKQISSR